MPNSMELFGQLLKGQLPVRVPVAVNMLDQGAEELGMDTKEYYSSAENVAAGQLKLRQKYHHDVVWGAHYAARQTEALGSKRTIFPTNGPPNVGDLVIKSYKDIEKLEIPDDITDHPSIQIQLDTVRMLNQELGGTAPVCAFQVGSFTLPTILMGMGQWLELFLTGPRALVDELLKKCSDYTIKTFTAFKAAGAAMVAYSNPFASTDIFSMAQLQEKAVRWIAEDVKGMGADGLVYFSGGTRINSIIPLLVEQTPIGAFYLHPDDNITEAKNAVAGKALIAAPINDIPLVNCSAEDVRRDTTRIIEEGAPGGGFIFGTLVMPHNIPESNIHALIETAHEVGTYAKA